MASWCSHLALTLSGVLLAACTGSVASPAGGFLGSEGSSSQGPAGTGTGAGNIDKTNPVSGTTKALCTTPAVSEAPMRRLTHHEYGNAVRDLVGASDDVERTLSADTQAGLFDTMASRDVATLLADEYLDAASALAEGISDVRSLVGCAPAAANEACVRGFTDRFARRAYRRPLTDAERTRLAAVYEAARSAADADTAVRALVAAVLASPHFLFRPEWGGDKTKLANALTVAPYEMATRLSFLLWSSVPDDELLDAAAANELKTPAQLTAQAKRMLADPRGRSANYDFFKQWFGLSLLETSTKDPAVYPQFDDKLRSAMGEETRRFVDHVVWEDDAKLSTLLSAPYSFVNKSLAAHYQVSGPSDDATFKQTQFDPNERSGILTQASFLTAFAASENSSPVKRGTWIRTRLLCQDLPAPPANVPPLPEFQEGISNRDRFALHTSAPACAGCHKLIDGLGFGLEQYDGIGAMREMDHGAKVDASGEVANTVDIDGKYEGGPELASLLASSDQVRDCAVTQWFRYSQGRREGQDDACSLEGMKKSFAKSDGDLQQLLVDFIVSDAFTHYRAPG
jgi:Protein of unknown function (DUF1592)/Protein of unknown function (DUF1588)/Protein of unknown function (DUF1595)/Protein of unknown function (DUF1587)/Protein of unknown function (DUF1585)